MKLIDINTYKEHALSDDDILELCQVSFGGDIVYMSTVYRRKLKKAKAKADVLTTLLLERDLKNIENLIKNT